MNATVKRFYRTAALMLGSFWLATPPVWPNEYRQIIVTLTTRVPPCTINNGNLIDVPFGDSMFTTRVDGKNNRRPINFTLNCSSQALKLSVTGEGAAFDDTVLKTSNTNLGVQIINNGEVQPLNSWRNFTWPTLPVLEAVLVKNPDEKLEGGPFSASATLRVDYQ